MKKFVVTLLMVAIFMVMVCACHYGIDKAIDNAYYHGYEDGFQNGFDHVIYDAEIYASGNDLPGVGFESPLIHIAIDGDTYDHRLAVY